LAIWQEEIYRFLGSPARFYFASITNLVACRNRMPGVVAKAVRWVSLTAEPAAGRRHLSPVETWMPIAPRYP